MTRSEAAGLKQALAGNIIILTLAGVTVTFFVIILSLLRTISRLRCLVSSYSLRHTLVTRETGQLLEPETWTPRDQL